MKTLLFALCFVTAVVTAEVQPADPEQTLERVVAETVTAHSATTVQELSVTEMTSYQLIRLGRTVMGVMVGDPRWHEWMNAMMGGEGSRSQPVGKRGFPPASGFYRWS